jgi:hypothetical protein
MMTFPIYGKIKARFHTTKQIIFYVSSVISGISRIGKKFSSACAKVIALPPKAHD